MTDPNILRREVEDNRLKVAQLTADLADAQAEIRDFIKATKTQAAELAKVAQERDEARTEARQAVTTLRALMANVDNAKKALDAPSPYLAAMFRYGGGRVIPNPEFTWTENGDNPTIFGAPIFGIPSSRWPSERWPQGSWVTKNEFPIWGNPDDPAPVVRPDGQKSEEKHEE